MKISVCTLSARQWNFTDILSRLSAQTHPDFEWVVVDFYHEENQVSLAIQAELFGVRLVHLSPVPGGQRFMRDIARNRNHALCHASGEAVIFLDDYVVINHDFIEQHQQLLSKGVISCGRMHFVEPGVSYVLSDGSQVQMLAQVLTSLNKPGQELLVQPDHRHKTLELRGFPQPVLCAEWTYTGNLGIPMSVVETLNGFDPRLTTRGEDCDFGLRAGALGIPAFYNPLAESINLPVDGHPCRYPFDHEHPLTVLNDHDTKLASDPELQNRLNVRVIEKHGCQVAVCNQCNAEYLLDPVTLIKNKLAAKEFSTDRALFDLSAERF